jgi:predicted 3-demethylubiquinone-9 3-methyltransferase (glyoxalase superfamily)
MTPKNTICLWFDKDAHEAARRAWSSRTGGNHLGTSRGGMTA